MPAVACVWRVAALLRSATVTAGFDGGGQIPTVWFAYGASPSSMTILSKQILATATTGATQVSITGLGSGDCYAEAFVKNSIGTSNSAPVHCAT